MTKLIGLHVNTGQTAAALLVDGEIVAAAAEERFSRIKQSRDFPVKAIRYCLDQAGLSSVSELDGIAVSWNPAENMRRINLSGFTSWRRYDPEWLYMVPNNIMSMGIPDDFASHALKLGLSGASACPFWFVTHHEAHLAHAIHQGPFETGLALVVDEYGEHDSVTAAVFTPEGCRVVKRIAYPHSLGVFYAACTEYLGFVPNGDEWKVMGAAAYGSPARFRPALGQILEWRSELGEWRLDTRLIEHSNMKRAGYLNDDLIRLLGIPPRGPGEALRQEHYDLAAAAQSIFEERLFQLITVLCQETKQTNLVAAGGCFMNSLANGRIIGNTPVERLFVPYAAADNGGAMGAALHVWHEEMGNPLVVGKGAASPYLGPEFSDEEVEGVLLACKLKFTKVPDPAETAAEMLTQGLLVGWFQGRMEFGERALGNRSILADPRNSCMKKALNAAVKYREDFRPFAPAIKYDAVSSYFDFPEGETVPYMEKVYPFKVDKRNEVPAVVHADGTGRLQTVSQMMNPLFYRLLDAFHRRTAVPLVLNTSFNVQGEPIVCTPRDAVRTFFTCGLDVLVLGSFLVRKDGE